MTERELRYRSGWYLIVLHVFILLSLVVLRLQGGFSTQEFTTLLGIVAPMFSGYTSAILTFIIKDRHNRVDRSRTVTRTYAALLFVMPTVLAGVVSLAIWLQAYRRAFENFEDCKTFVMSFELAFAVYVGIVVFSAFERKEQDTAKTANAGRG